MAGHVAEAALVEVYRDTNSWHVRDSLLLTPGQAMFYTGMDFGFPAIRASSSPRPLADGTDDYTNFTGSKALSIELTVFDDMFQGLEANVSDWNPQFNYSSYWLDELSGWQVPSRKNLRLYYRLEGQTRARFCELVPAGMTAPIVMEDRDIRKVQLQYVVPGGRSYAFDETPGRSTPDGRSSITIGPGDAGADIPGLSFPLTFPLVWPTTAYGAGPSELVSAGKAPAPLTVEVYSGSADLVDPSLELVHVDAAGVQDQPSGRIAIRNFTVPAGQFFTVDDHQVFLGYDRANRLTGYLGATNWLTVHPGRNQLVLSGGSIGTDASAIATWFDAYLL